MALVPVELGWEAFESALAADREINLARRANNMVV